MQAIWKYPVYLNVNQFDLLMPQGAQVVSFQIQNERPVIWAIVDSDKLQDDLRRFYVVATGFEIPDEKLMRFIGTVQVNSGEAWHLFEPLQN